MKKISLLLIIAYISTTSYGAQSWPFLNDYFMTSEVNTYADGNLIYGQIDGDANLKVDENIEFQIIKPASYTATFDFNASSGNYYVSFNASENATKFANENFSLKFTNSGTCKGHITIAGKYTLGTADGSSGFKWDSSGIKGSMVAKGDFYVLDGAEIKVSSLETKAIFSNSGTMTANGITISSGSTFIDNSGLTAFSTDVRSGATLEINSAYKTEWLTLQGGTVKINTGGDIVKNANNDLVILKSITSTTTLVLAEDVAFSQITLYDNGNIDAHTNGKKLTFNGIGRAEGKLNIYIDKDFSWVNGAISFKGAAEDTIKSVIGDIYFQDDDGNYIKQSASNFVLETVNSTTYLNLVSVPEPALSAVIFGILTLIFTIYRRQKK